MRKTAALLAMVIFIAGVPLNVWAEDTVTVIVDGRKVEFTDAHAYIDANGKTQVPTRFVGTSAISNVTIIEFTIGSENYYSRISRQGKPETHTRDTTAVIEDARAYIPVRYVAEALNAAVDWNPKQKRLR